MAVFFSLEKVVRFSSVDMIRYPWSRYRICWREGVRDVRLYFRKMEKIQSVDFAPGWIPMQDMRALWPDGAGDGSAPYQARGRVSRAGIRPTEPRQPLQILP